MVPFKDPHTFIFVWRRKSYLGMIKTFAVFKGSYQMSRCQKYFQETIQYDSKELSMKLEYWLGNGFVLGIVIW